MTTEERLQRLEDIEAIRRVTADYAAAINWGAGDAVDRDGIRAVLSEDIQWKARDEGRCARYRCSDGGDRPAAARHDARDAQLQHPQIDVVGDTAKGNWLLWVAKRAGDKTDQVFQSEELTYICTGSGWRIASIDLHFGATLNG